MKTIMSSRDGDEQHRDPKFELCTTCGGNNFTPVLVMNIAVFLVQCERCHGMRIEPKLTMYEAAAAMKSMMELAIIVRNQG